MASRTKARPQKAKGLCQKCFYNTGGKCAKKVFQFPKAKKCKEYAAVADTRETPEDDPDKSFTPRRAPAALLTGPKPAERTEPTEAELKRLRQFDSYFED